MPSPKTAMHLSDAVSALLMGHQQQPPSEVVSYSFQTEANSRKESVVVFDKKGTILLPKHGFTIEEASLPKLIHTESILASHCTTNMFDTNTSTSPRMQNPITEASSANMEIEVDLPISSVPQRRPRSGSEGLDYLAFLAEQERRSFDLLPPTTATEHFVPSGSSGIGSSNSTGNIGSGDPMLTQQYISERPQSIALASSDSVVTPPTTIVNHPQTSSSSSSSSSDTDDSEAMPPPQPRRPRSISNPDYMMIVQSQQQHFVLPPNLLREELAKARSAVVRKAAAEITMSRYCYDRYGLTTIGSSNFCGSSTIPEHAVYLQQSNNDDHYDYDNHDIEEEEVYDDDELRPESGDEYDDDDNDDIQDEVDIMDKDSNVSASMQTSISSIELLRRARSRLLEDLLSETNTLNGTHDRTITMLPHTLSKYKMVSLCIVDLSVSSLQMDRLTVLCYRYFL